MSRHHAKLDRRRWAHTRRVVFEADCWRCRSCGKAGRLECDHVTPLDADPSQDPYDPAGCQTLCVGCHKAKTAEERGRPRQSEAWRRVLDNLT